MGGRWLNRHKNWIAEEADEPEDMAIEPEGYGVPFYPLKCPKCQSKNVRCYVSRPPIRYHYCRDCGKKFKSVETE
jgi:transposase-like protein